MAFVIITPGSFHFWLLVWERGGRNIVGWGVGHLIRTVSWSVLPWARLSHPPHLCVWKAQLSCEVLLSFFSVFFCFLLSVTVHLLFHLSAPPQFLPSPLLPLALPTGHLLAFHLSQTDRSVDGHCFCCAWHPPSMLSLLHSLLCINGRHTIAPRARSSSPFDEPTVRLSRLWRQMCVRAFCC